MGFRVLCTPTTVAMMDFGFRMLTSCCGLFRKAVRHHKGPTNYLGSTVGLQQRVLSGFWGLEHKFGIAGIHLKLATRRRS